MSAVEVLTGRAEERFEPARETLSAEGFCGADPVGLGRAILSTRTSSHAIPIF